MLPYVDIVSTYGVVSVGAKGPISDIGTKAHDSASAAYYTNTKTLVVSKSSLERFMNKYNRWTLAALFALLIPFGPLALTAKDFAPQQPQRLSKPAMAPVAGEPSTAGEKLFKQLHDQTSANGSFVPKPYDQARFFLYSKADVVEQDGAEGVMDMYSNTFMEGVSGSDCCHVECKDANGDGKINFEDLVDVDREVCEKGSVVGNRPISKCKAGAQDMDGDGSTGDFINIEHLWPKSAFGKIEELVGDIHNLRPSFSKPNAARGSNTFGEGSFSPAMKGDVARALFYFALTYYNRIPSGAAGQYFTKSVPMLMKWNREDPPSEYEIRRTELAAQFQGNTNPFVTNPGYVDQIGQQVWQSLFR